LSKPVNLEYNKEIWQKPKNGESLKQRKTSIKEKWQKPKNGKSLKQHKTSIKEKWQKT